MTKETRALLVEMLKELVKAVERPTWPVKFVEKRGKNWQEMTLDAKAEDARKEDLAAGTLSLNKAAEMFTCEFPEVSEAAAKSRLQRARAKLHGSRGSAVRENEKATDTAQMENNAKDLADYKTGGTSAVDASEPLLSH